MALVLEGWRRAGRRQGLCLLNPKLCQLKVFWALSGNGLSRDPVQADHAIDPGNDLGAFADVRAVFVGVERVALRGTLDSDFINAGLEVHDVINAFTAFLVFQLHNE